MPATLPARRPAGRRRRPGPLPLRLSELILIATIACVSLTAAVQSLAPLVAGLAHR